MALAHRQADRALSGALDWLLCASGSLRLAAVPGLSVLSRLYMSVACSGASAKRASTTEPASS